MAIKGVLKEELDNSIRMKESYEKELAKLPVGSLIKKRSKDMSITTLYLGKMVMLNLNIKAKTYRMN